MARNFTVFISHSWDYVNDLKNLRNLLKTRSYFNVDFSEVPPSAPIKSQNADYIKRVLREKINQSDIVLGLAGIYASHSEWMEWELDTALSCRIPVVGVIPRGQTNLSRVVTSRSIIDVGWGTESIVNAIRACALNPNRH